MLEKYLEIFRFDKNAFFIENYKLELKNVDSYINCSVCNIQN